MQEEKVVIEEEDPHSGYKGFALIFFFKNYIKNIIVKKDYWQMSYNKKMH